MLTRTCKTCQEVKGIEKFALRERGMRRQICNSCRSKRRRAEYTPEQAKEIQERNARWRAKTKRRNYEWLWNYFLDHPCPCGETDPVVLHMDHRDPSEKTSGVAPLMAWAPLNRIQEEVAKCDVLCANCHARRTAKQFGWYSFLPSGEE